MDILQLDNYAFTRLLVTWHDLATEEEEVAMTRKMEYSIKTHRSESTKYALKLRVHIKGGTAKKPKAYDIDCELTGFFECPPQWTEQQCFSQVRVNGTLLLYGTLRGHVAEVTGMFPAGKYILPTINVAAELAETDKSQSRKPTSRKRSTSGKLII